MIKLIDRIARIWEIEGVEYTLLELPFDTVGDETAFQKRLGAWVNAHCKGEWVSTPVYIGFKIPSDALIFKMGFTH